MKNALMTVAEAAEIIESGAVALLAGSEEALRQLPRGRWIGGTAVYFFTTEGGFTDRERVFCTVITEALDTRIAVLDAEHLPDLSEGRYPTGFTVILIPAFCETHTAFAMEAARYPGVFEQPLLGWIAGVHLDEIGKVKPLVFNGETGEAHEDGAALLYVELPRETPARLDIVNIFSQREDRIFVFAENGFEVSRAMINGEMVDLAPWLTEQRIDTRLPLVANYAGALINVSIQEVNLEENRVKFYAPVVANVEYRLARDLASFADAFAERSDDSGADDFSCNCILNYVYGELEGRSIGECTGPATFGEIAYMLLNQTMVRLTVKNNAA